MLYSYKFNICRLHIIMDLNGNNRVYIINKMKTVRWGGVGGEKRGDNKVKEKGQGTGRNKQNKNIGLNDGLDGGLGGDLDGGLDGRLDCGLDGGLVS